MNSVTPDIEPMLTLPERLWNAAAATLDAERERADAWERRAQRLSLKLAEVYEAFGVRLAEMERQMKETAEVANRCANLMQPYLLRTPEEAEDMADQIESHRARGE